MKVTFHGAAREVTGSCHLVEVAGKRILLDCGMIQGGSERHERNRQPFPFEPAKLDFVVLSHAHIDHSGRLPLLRKRGFKGPILSTEATAHLCRILCKYTSLEGEYAFLCGLLHDVGIAATLIAFADTGPRKRAPDLIAIWPAV